MLMVNVLVLNQAGDGGRQGWPLLNILGKTKELLDEGVFAMDE